MEHIISTQLLVDPRFWLLISGVCIACLVNAVYRLYYHPLSKFPGPGIAAVTSLYEGYYDILCAGQFNAVLKEMHRKHGPIVRISPDEIHIDDPDFYNELYTGPTNPRDQWSRTADPFSIPTSFFSTVPADLHRLRRAPLNPFFSKRMVTSLSPSILANVEKLSKRIAGFRGTEKILSMKYAYAALALDVVTEYAFGKPFAALDDPDFSHQFADLVDGFVSLTHLNLALPWLAPLMKSLPLWAVKIVNPKMMEQIRFQMGLREQIQAIMQDPEKEKYKLNGHPTIFHELVQSEELPIADRNINHFQEEGQNIVAAGQATTAYHLSVTTYHVLANDHILSRLKQELEAAIPDSDTLPSLAKLEELEYLSAVISEGHRVTHGIVHRMQRVSPKSPIRYNDWVIPPGTPVGITNMFVHQNPDIYPEPDVFDPTRFLGPQGEQRRKKYLVSFSRGTRSCLGQNLAMAELYFVLAMVFRRHDLKLWGTTVDDVTVVHDYIVPQPAYGSKGVRVTVQ